MTVSQVLALIASVVIVTSPFSGPHVVHLVREALARRHDHDDEGAKA